MLVHAALDHVPGPLPRRRGRRPRRAICAANVGGSLALLATARETPACARCVVLSSRAVFGALADRRIGSPTTIRSRPTPIYGAAKAALEAFVQNWGAAKAGPIAALRPTGVYGIVVPAERSKWFDLVGERAATARRCEPRAGTEVHGRDVAERRVAAADGRSRRGRRPRVQLQRHRRLDARHRAAGAAHRGSRGPAAGASCRRRRTSWTATGCKRSASRSAAGRSSRRRSRSSSRAARARDSVLTVGRRPWPARSKAAPAALPAARPRARGRAVTRSCSVCWSSTSMKAPSAVPRMRLIGAAGWIRHSRAAGRSSRPGCASPRSAGRRRRCGSPPRAAPASARRGGRASS